MKLEKGNHHSNAKAVIALLVLALVFALFIKIVYSINYLYNDPELLQKYVIFAIVGGGFLIGLLYLVNQSSSVKAKSKKKKK